jgi:hypothetical protein
MTNAERERLRRHEAWISQPVKVLFKDQIAKGKTGVCRECGISFIYRNNKPKSYCTSECKDHFAQRVKKRPLPAMTAGAWGRAGDTPSEG